MKGTPLSWVRVALTALLCVVLWTWLARRADLPGLATQAGRLPAWAWLAAAAGLLAGHGLRALRLQREWRDRQAVPWWQCLRIVLAHNALVILLPLRSGEVGFLWGVQRQWGVSWAAAGVVLLRWRLQDAAVLGVLALLLLAPLDIAARVLMAVAGALVLWFLLPPLWSWLLRRTGQLQASSDREWWSGLPASAGNWSLKVLANGCLLAALGGVSLTAGWRGALGGELAGVQPFQPPAGLGTYEGGTWLAMALPGYMESRLISAALAVHAFSLAIALGAAALTQLPLPQLRGQEETVP